MIHLYDKRNFIYVIIHRKCNSKYTFQLEQMKLRQGATERSFRQKYIGDYFKKCRLFYDIFIFK